MRRETIYHLYSATASYSYLGGRCCAAVALLSRALCACDVPRHALCTRANSTSPPPRADGSRAALESASTSTSSAGSRAALAGPRRVVVRVPRVDPLLRLVCERSLTWVWWERAVAHLGMVGAQSTSCTESSSPSGRAVESDTRRSTPLSGGVLHCQIAWNDD
jgi:hypothetical protein